MEQKMSPLQEEIKFYLSNILGKPLITEEEIEQSVKEYSVIDELRVKKKVTDEFLRILHKLTLEELILLKLEYTSQKTKTIVPLKMFRIVQSAMEFVVVKYALSCFGTMDEVLSYLGMKKKEFVSVREAILRAQVGAERLGDETI